VNRNDIVIETCHFNLGEEKVTMLLIRNVQLCIILCRPTYHHVKLKNGKQFPRSARFFSTAVFNVMYLNLTPKSDILRHFLQCFYTSIYRK